MAPAQLALSLALLCATSALAQGGAKDSRFADSAEARIKRITTALEDLKGKPDILRSDDAYAFDFIVGDQAAGAEWLFVQVWVYSSADKAQKDWETAVAAMAKDPLERVEPHSVDAGVKERLTSRAVPGDEDQLPNSVGVAFSDAVRTDLRVAFICRRFGTTKRKSEEAKAIERGEDPATEKLRDDATRRVRALVRRVFEADVPVELPKPEIAIELLDANPLFTALPVEAIPSEYATLAKLTEKRDGAAADGASAVLLRAIVKRGFWARFAIEGGSGDGRVQRIDDRVDGSVTNRANTDDIVAPVFAIAAAGNRQAYALYVPPSELGSAQPDKRERPVRIKVEVFEMDAAPADAQRMRKPVLNAGAKAIETATRDLRLIRPPVLLVHGTYSDPDDAWIQPYVAGGKGTLARLRELHFDVSCVDYKGTNGSSKGGPSHFADNERVVTANPGGLTALLSHMRGKCDRAACTMPHLGKEAFAVTRADLVCHSLGGTLTRVYARGFSLRGKAPPPREHFDPARRACDGCWYHRPDNLWQGDIRRLITLSSTHNGSDICRVFTAYQEVLDEAKVDKMASAYGLDRAATEILLMMANDESGLGGAFIDQTPYSEALRSLGPTPVALHAIACMNRFDPMVDRVHPTDLFYRERLNKIWFASSPRVLQLAFTRLGQPNDAQNLSARRLEEFELIANIARSPAQEARLEQLRIENPKLLGDAVFGHIRHDCTVRQESSHAGLDPAFTTSIDGVWHSDAPRFPKVQDKVIALLIGPESAFSPSVPDTAFLQSIEWQSGKKKTNDGPPGGR